MDVGNYTFSDCLFYLQTEDLLETVSFNSAQEIDDYNGDSVCRVLCSLENQIPFASRVISSLECRFMLKLLMNHLFPFLQQRRTKVKALVFVLSRDSVATNGTTTHDLNGELLRITFNLKNIHSIGAFIYVLIHELSHTLLPFTDENGAM